LIPSNNTSNIGNSNNKWNNLYVNNANFQNFTVNEKVTSDLIPNNSKNLGSNSNKWNNLYVNNANFQNLNVNEKVTTNLIPDNSENLGSNSNEWNNLYVKQINFDVPSAGNKDIIKISYGNNNYHHLIDSYGYTIESTSNPPYRNFNITNFDQITLGWTVAGGIHLFTDLIPRYKSYTNGQPTGGDGNGNINIGSTNYKFGNLYVNTVNFDFTTNQNIIEINYGTNYNWRHRIHEDGGKIYYVIEPTTENGKNNSDFMIEDFRVIHLGSGATKAIDCYCNLSPGTDNSIDIGSSSYKFKDLYINDINGSAYNSGSDDRIKHNEINILNGLNIIRKLNPKKYQKTFEMYAENYNGEISGSWFWEAGLIAQDILKIDDLSFCVTGGNYYDKSNNLIEEIHYLNYNSIFNYNIAATKELDLIVQEQQEEINNFKTELANTKSILTNTKNELANTKNELTNIKNELANIKSLLNI
jgi:hypothetical protein